MQSQFPYPRKRLQLHSLPANAPLCETVWCATTHSIRGSKGEAGAGAAANEAI